MAASTDGRTGGGLRPPRTPPIASAFGDTATAGRLSDVDLTDPVLPIRAHSADKKRSDLLWDLFFAEWDLFESQKTQGICRMRSVLAEWDRFFRGQQIPFSGTKIHIKRSHSAEKRDPIQRMLAERAWFAPNGIGFWLNGIGFCRMGSLCHSAAVRRMGSL